MYKANPFTSWKPFDESHDFPVFAGPPDACYLIAATQRSGSYYLSYLLRGTGRLGAPLEYLHPGHADTWLKELGASNLNELLERLFARRTSPNGWFGVKAHCDHFQWASQQGLPDTLKFKHFIRIERRDRLRQAVPLALARQTQSWLSLQKKGRKPKYDDGAITRALQILDGQSDKWEDWAEQTGVHPIRVYHEDLVADPLSVVNGILLEFGLDPIAELPPVPIDRQSSTVNDDWYRRYISRGALLKRTIKRVVKRILGLDRGQPSQRRSIQA